jgi:hypothetical protein
VRYALLNIVRRLMYAPGVDPDRQERVCSCHYRRKASTVDIRMDPRRGRAHFRGIETCGSVWLCPVCSGRITEERRGELQRAVNMHVEGGGEVYLVTLTFPHARADRLVTAVDLLRLALRRFNSSKTMRAVRAESGHIGSIRALEVTWGSWHGWHPHVHLLWFAKRGQMETIKRLAPAWVESLIKAKLADRSQQNDMLHGAAGRESPAFDVSNGDYAAEYVAKWGHEPSLHSKIEAGETWGIAREMVSGQVKTGRRLTGVTPFTLLAVIAGKCEVRGMTAGRAAALFAEFAYAFKGERQLYWSPRLRAALKMGRLFGDEELEAAADALPEVETVITLTADDWRLLILHECRHAALLAAEQFGAAGVRGLLADLRGRPSPAKPPGLAMVEQRTRWPSPSQLDAMGVPQLGSKYHGGLR